jgi:hypothetical protein
MWIIVSLAASSASAHYAPPPSHLMIIIHAPARIINRWSIIPASAAIFYIVLHVVPPMHVRVVNLIII